MKWLWITLALVLIILISSSLFLILKKGEGEETQKVKTDISETTKFNDNAQVKSENSFLTYESTGGFYIDYPNSWKVFPIKLETLGKEGEHYLGSINIIPEDGIIDSSFSEAFRLNPQRIKTQFLSLVVFTDDPGDDNDFDFTSEFDDTFIGETSFGGFQPKILEKKESDSSATWLYTYDEKYPIKGKMKILNYYNKDKGAEQLFVIHYRAKTDNYDAKIADNFIDSFNI